MDRNNLLIVFYYSIGNKRETKETRTNYVTLGSLLRCSACARSCHPCHDKTGSRACANQARKKTKPDSRASAQLQRRSPPCLPAHYLIRPPHTPCEHRDIPRHTDRDNMLHVFLLLSSVFSISLRSLSFPLFYISNNPSRFMFLDPSSLVCTSNKTKIFNKENERYFRDAVLSTVQSSLLLRFCANTCVCLPVYEHPHFCLLKI